MKIEGLDPKDHEFIPDAETMSVIKGPEYKPSQKTIFQWIRNSINEKRIDWRWNDFVDEKKSRGLEAKDGDLVLTRPEYCEPDNTGYKVNVFTGKFKPWVTSRPAFTYSNGKRPGPIKDYSTYSVGTGALFFIEDRYLVFGGRHWREVGGEIDTPPAGFLKIDDLKSEDPALHGMIREGEGEVVKPFYSKEDGVMKSDFWRNLAACYYLWVPVSDLERKFDLQEHDDIVVLKRKIPKKGKYGEDGLYMVPIGILDKYVVENAPRFGERASLLLKRYFERA